MDAPGNALQPVARTALSLSIGDSGISSDTLKVYRVTGHEAISKPFRYEIELVRDGGNVSFGDVLGKDATLEIKVADGSATMPGVEMVRRVHGVVEEFMVEESVDDDGNTEHHYRAVLVPRLAMLARNRQNRIHATSAPQTLEEIIRHKLLSSGPDYGTEERGKRVVLEIDEFHMDIDDDGGKAPLASLSHVAQYNETDLDFIRRLCESQGVYFFFASNAHKPAVLMDPADPASTGAPEVPEDSRGMVVFANTNRPFGVIRFQTEADGDTYENEHRLDIDLTLTGTTGLSGGWTQTSFDPGISGNPDDDVVAKLEGVLEEFRSVHRPTPANLQVMATADREVDLRRMVTLDGASLGIHTARGIYTDYDTHFSTRTAGDAFAGIRSQEFKAANNYFIGSTSSPSVAPGRTFTKKPPKDSTAADRKFLVTAVDIEVTQAHAGFITEIDGEVIQTAFGNRFRCIEFDEVVGTSMEKECVFRPPRETPIPRVHGVHTAYIGTGEEGRPKLDEDGAYRIYNQFVDERVRFVVDTGDDDEGNEGDEDDEASEPASAEWLGIDRLSKAVRKGEPYAGDGVGMHFPLKRDTEVLVAYRNGDPDRPVIAAAMPGPLDHASPVTRVNPTSHVVTTSSGARFEIHDDYEDSKSRIALQSRETFDKASYVRLGKADTRNASVPETLEDYYEKNVVTVEKEKLDGIALYTADNIREV